MSLFEHYLYVLECEDGSLYTGYSTDVATRVAAHQTGKGAKYTKSHAPVRLVAQARFYSKERAMSAEARFKRLSRVEKERLLTQAVRKPFEDVLRCELPGFGEDPAIEFVCRSLAENVDASYRNFQSKLMPSVDPRTVAGVRTPVLRKIAKRLVRCPDARSFLTALPHRTFDENQVHALAIGLTRDYNAAIALYREFLPFVDNWATCDQLPVKPLAQRPAETIEQVERWLTSGQCYSIRFAMRVLMALYLREQFEPRFLGMVAGTRLPGAPDTPAPASEAYYVDMMRAWYFAEALALQETAALPYFEPGGGQVPLDEWTRRRAIRKARESLKIAPELKERLKWPAAW